MVKNKPKPEKFRRFRPQAVPASFVNPWQMDFLCVAEKRLLPAVFPVI